MSKDVWEDSLYVSCSCGCDVMRITKWDDIDEFASLCIFKSSSMGTWQRIREAWRYLRLGEFAYNDMMLTKGDAERMAKFLTEIPFSAAPLLTED